MSKKIKFNTPDDAEKHMIDNILEEFDFKKCESVMGFLNWRWAISNGPVTVDMLKKSAVDRIQSAIGHCKKERTRSQAPCWSSSGGLKATVWKNNYGHITEIKLEFILTEWEHDGDY